MKITKNVDQTTLTLALEGRLDTTTAPEMEAAIDESLTGIQYLILDLTALEYISSAGLRVLLKAQKLMNSREGMKLVGVNETILEVLEITGFIDILTVE